MNNSNQFLGEYKSSPNSSAEPVNITLSATNLAYKTSNNAQWISIPIGQIVGMHTFNTSNVVINFGEYPYQSLTCRDEQFLKELKIQCHDFPIVANLFKNEDASKLEKKLVEDLKFDSNSAMKIVFLIKLLDLKPENVLELYNLKNRSKSDDALIIDWLTVNQQNDEKLFTKFLNFKPTVDAQEIIKMGLKGKQIGDKIRELETSNFLKMINM
jgi:hypothetical protein